jgi:SAM-dependent methyltransferase
MSVGYWLKYFALAGVMLLMQKRLVREPLIAVAKRLGYAKPELGPEVCGGIWDGTTKRHLEIVRFFEESRIRKDARILDVGCGSGGLVRQLRARGYTCVAGCDWKDIDADFPFTRADLNTEGLSAYADGSFDVAVSSEVIEHLENPAHILRELRRVVVPDGHVFVTIPNCWNLFERVQFFLGGNSTRYHRPSLAPEYYSHISMFTSNVMETLTDRAQLELVELRGSFAYIYRHFWGTTSDPLYSYVLMYHYTPRRAAA